MKLFTFSLAITVVITLWSCSKSDETTPEQTTIKDGDGNTYTPIVIGTQTWLLENLKSITFNDGTPIPNVTSSEDWIYTDTPAYCWYDNDVSNYKSTYGALYNWYVVDKSSNGNKNICPKGWHIPSQTEWETLLNFLGGPLKAYGKLKEAGLEHWITPNFDASNSSAFTGLPGGSRGGQASVALSFAGMGYNGYWWSTTEFDSSEAWVLRLQCFDPENSFDGGHYFYKSCAFSIRCIKD